MRCDVCGVQRVVVGNFIESTATADQRHRNELLRASGKQQASGTKISSSCSIIVRRMKERETVGQSNFTKKLKKVFDLSEHSSVYWWR